MNRYKYDMHVHTSETSSCGMVPADRVVKMHKEAGYDGIFITDHYYDGYFERLTCDSWEEKVNSWLAGYKAAKVTGDKAGLTVFPGMELRFSDSPNDYLVYGADEDFLKNNPELYNLSLKEFNYLARNNGLLIYQAHPYRHKDVAPAELLFGIEVHNGNPRHNSHNELAMRHALDNNLHMLSGSDFHQTEDIARGGIITENKIGSADELLNVLRLGDYELITNFHSQEESFW